VDGNGAGLCPITGLAINSAQAAGSAIILHRSACHKSV